MGNPVVHWELWSQDAEGTSEFYSTVFGWQVQHIPEMNYRIVDTDSEGGINGGIFSPAESGPWPGNMAFYIDVDDLAAYREKIVAAGGTMIIEEQEVPGMGWFGLFADPEGRVLGIWKQTEMGEEE